MTAPLGPERPIPQQPSDASPPGPPGGAPPRSVLSNACVQRPSGLDARANRICHRAAATASQTIGTGHPLARPPGVGSNGWWLRSPCSVRSAYRAPCRLRRRTVPLRVEPALGGICAHRQPFPRAGDGKLAASAVHRARHRGVGLRAHRRRLRDHDARAGARERDAPSRGVLQPGGNASQVSWLRLVNPTEEAVEVTIAGRDDAGESAPAGAVSLTLAPGKARTLRAWPAGGENPPFGYDGSASCRPNHGSNS